MTDRDVNREPPVYVAKKAGCRMIMDGFLDESAWQSVKSVGDFVFPWYESGERFRTTAKILWDDERLYFAFDCEDKYIWAEYYRHNDPVSRDSCCEAFIAPAPDGPARLDYINYEINCLGTWKVGYHADSRGLVMRDWHDCRHLEIGRVIRGTCNDDSDFDEGWTLEFSVPFSHFADFGAQFPPRDGQIVRIGLNRCGGKTNPQYSQWAPSSTSEPQFHSPVDFGTVILSTETAG